jgi:hypothetical protein
MYNTAFTREQIGETTLDKARELSIALWNKEGTFDTKMKALRKFCKEVAPLYEIPVPRVRYNKMLNQMQVYGTSNYTLNAIMIGKFSLVTFLHEFRHQIQYKLWNMSERDFFNQELRDKMEEDARGWSVSIFYILHPDKYQKAVDNNRLVFK